MSCYSYTGLLPIEDRAMFQATLRYPYVDKPEGWWFLVRYLIMNPMSIRVGMCPGCLTDDPKNFCNLRKAHIRGRRGYRFIKSDKDTTCPICLLSISPGELASVTRCNHTFHGKCFSEFREFRRDNNSGENYCCPCCRTDLGSPRRGLLAHTSF